MVCPKVIRYLLLSIGFLFIPAIVNASDSRTPEVKIFSTPSTELVESYLGFAERFSGGMSVAVCDLNGDGYDETIIGAGQGGGPQVRILNQDGEPIFTPGFFAYGTDFRGGVNVACGDLDNDGTGEIVTAPLSKGGPQVRVFNRYGEPIFTPGFFAYESNFTGGVNIAVGDVDGGGLKEIIVAPKTGREPEVKIFNRYGTLLDFDIYPFHPEFTGGVSIAIANVDGGPEDELILGVQSQDSALIKVIKVGVEGEPLGNFFAFPEDFKGGVNLAGGDIDNDGYDEVLVVANTGGGPHVRSFEAYGKLTSVDFLAYESDFRGGVKIAAGDLFNNGKTSIVTVPTKKLYEGRVDKIIVDLSEQRLYAYEQGLLLKTFLVSTGLPSTPTRPGDFKISQKIYSKLYSGPDFYLPNTLWNMRFDGSRLLHGAYWHDNFGHRMSHGCVNIAYPDAEWLYNSTPMGVQVIVQD